MDTASRRRTQQVRSADRSSKSASRALVVLVWITAVTGLAGGVLLAVAADGSLMTADPAVLSGSPFADYFWPGVLLATLVGGGFLLVGFLMQMGVRGARPLAVVAGVGLVVFETIEWAWIGFHPLQAVFVIVGVVVALLALRLIREQAVLR